MKRVVARCLLPAVVLLAACGGTSHGGDLLPWDPGPLDVLDVPDVPPDPGVPDPGARDLGPEDAPDPADPGVDTGLPTCRTTADCAPLLAGPAPSDCLRPWCDPATSTCAWGPKPNGSPCDPGDPCAADGQCRAGECQGRPRDCDDGNPCTTDRCDALGQCLNEPADGACDDGNPCTADDACREGTCTGTGNTCACQADGQCADRDDGNRCNGTLACREGVCVVDPATVIRCEAPASPCLSSSCNPADGTCVTAAAHQGAPCDDGNLCTAGDRCGDGLCAGNPTVVCDDGNPCTTDDCTPAGGCFSTPNTLPCDDGNACTAGDACREGHCVGTSTGQCGCRADADCAAREDGNRCNGVLVCRQGTCTVDPATVVACDPLAFGACKVASCDPASGLCVATPLADGRPCDDGDACTLASTCQGGACVAVGGAPDCDDGNACTQDACDAAGGCVNTSRIGPCDDGNACTVGDTCTPGAFCAPGGPRDCQDGNPCTLDLCDPATGCAPQVLTGPCEDGSACTSGDTCTDGRCLGATVPCDDGNPCTVDACDPATGCTHAPILSGACDDGSVCTTGDRCVEGACAGTRLDCNDANVCTQDTCDALAGCRHDPLAGRCDDGLGCTTGDACTDGTCTGAPLACDDGNPCTDDGCQEGVGCTHVPNQAACDDLSACTTGDTCSGGACRGTPVECLSPPPNTCDADGVTLESHGVPGLCQATGCEYPVTLVPCAHGCADGACLGDPCAGIDCSTPPSGCLAPGTCAGGSCSYPYDDGKACDDGNPCTAGDTCGTGVCFGAPVTCNQPPADTCLDGATLQHWLPAGTCDPATGACGYPSEPLACAGGCVNDVCLGTLEMRQWDLTGAGGVGLTDGNFTTSCVLPGFVEGAAAASATWRVRAGFEP